MMSDELIPITDEQAKAIQESAKLGQDAIGLIKDAGGYLREILGTAPEDFVALIGGDWLRVRRIENMARIAAKARERLQARGVEKPEPISLTLALPLLRASSDESREQLQDLWARLLASAMDSKRAHQVRQEFVGIVRQLEPLDALVLQRMFGDQIDIGQKMNFNDFGNFVHAASDELDVSLRNLFRLDCVMQPGVNQIQNVRAHVVTLTATGRLLMRAASD